jgi:hypothetical protein
MTLSVNDYDQPAIAPSPVREERINEAVLLLVDQLVIAGVIGPATSEKVRARLVDQKGATP